MTGKVSIAMVVLVATAALTTHVAVADAAERPTARSVVSGAAADTASPGSDATTSYAAPSGAVFVSPSGSDTAAGSLAAPLRTLGAAVAKAPAGGTVVLRGGFYRDSFGRIGKKLTIQRYLAEAVTVTGADIIREWTRTTAG